MGTRMKEKEKEVIEMRRRYVFDLASKEKITIIEEITVE